MQSIKYLIGNPASGKTTILEKFKDDFCDDNTYIYDVNHFKEYENGVEYTDEQKRKIHADATRESYQYVESAICKGMNIVSENTFFGLMKSMKYFHKLKNRGMTIEVYFVEPDIGNDMYRNNKRDVPTPDDKFVDKATYNSILTEVIQSGLVDYIQFIDMKSLLGKDSLYSDLKFFKAVKKPLDIGYELKVEGDVIQDTNAIHYATTGAIARMYHSHVHVVQPIGKVYKYGNIFYSQGVKVIK